MGTFESEGVKRYLSFMTKLDEIRRQYDIFLQPHGLTYSQFSILDHLYTDAPEGDSPSVIADTYSISRQTMTGLLDKLEKDGLVERKNHEEDRRKKIIVLSDKGVKYCQSFLDSLHQTEQKCFSSLSEYEQVQLNVLTQRVVDGLKEHLVPSEKDPD